MKCTSKQTKMVIGSRTLIAATGYALSIVLVNAPARAEIVFGVDSSQDALYTVDLVTGAATLIGPLHASSSRYTTPIAMAVRPSDGAIFVNNNSPFGDNGLSSVDPSTGLATFIGGPFIDAALAFDLSGNLYAADNGRLATISQTTGSPTPLGGPLLPRLFGLDFNPADGLLYGLTTPAPASPVDLLQIDPATGALLSTITLSVTSVPGTLLFDSSGTLHGVTLGGPNNLFEINPATGAVSNFRTVTIGFLPQGMGLIGAFTPVGDDVVVESRDAKVKLTIKKVIAEGRTEVNSRPPDVGAGEGAPANYKACSEEVVYDMSTDAVFEEKIIVSMRYDDRGCGKAERMRLHVMDDATNEYKLAENQINKTEDKEVSGEVDSLAVMAVFEAKHDEGVSDDLTAIINANPSTTLAAKLGDAQASVETAVEELAQEPPDNQAAVGNFEGAVGSICDAVNDEGLDPGEGTQLMDVLAGIARQLAVEAIDEAIAAGGNEDDIAEAQASLDIGDVLRMMASGACDLFKDAVDEYKNALSEAEGALT